MSYAAVDRSQVRRQQRRPPGRCPRLLRAPSHRVQRLMQRATMADSARRATWHGALHFVTQERCPPLAPQGARVRRTIRRALQKLYSRSAIRLKGTPWSSPTGRPSRYGDRTLFEAYEQRRARTWLRAKLGTTGVIRRAHLPLCSQATHSAGAWPTRFRAQGHPG